MTLGDLYLDPLGADLPAPRLRHGMRVHPMETTDVLVAFDLGGRWCEATVTLDSDGGAWVSAELDGEPAELTDAQREAVVMAAMRR